MISLDSLLQYAPTQSVFWLETNNGEFGILPSLLFFPPLPALNISNFKPLVSPV